MARVIEFPARIATAQHSPALPARPGVAEVVSLPTPRAWRNVLDVHAAVAAIEARPKFEDRRHWWHSHCRMIERALRGRVAPGAIAEIIRRHTGEVRAVLIARGAAQSSPSDEPTSAGRRA